MSGRAPGLVLMTADTVGGVWTYAMELASGLGRRGTQVALAVMGPSMSRAQLQEALSIPGLEVYEGGFRLEWMEEPWKNIELSGDWLLRLESYVKPGIIHLNGFCHGALPWGAPALVAGHSCVPSWWDSVKKGPLPPRWDRYVDEVRRGLLAASAVAAPTGFMLGELRRLYGLGDKGTVIYNGRDPGLFTPAEKESFVLAAGRLWDEAKNASALAAASSRIGWPVYAAGPVENPAGSLMDCGRMRMLGCLTAKELSGWYARASIFALPAFYEPFGYTALEAGLSGAALVLGDIPSLREVWGDAAIFVDPGDVDAIAGNINMLIKDRASRKRLGELARARALRYTAEGMCDGYLGLYAAMLADKEAVHCAS